MGQVPYGVLTFGSYELYKQYLLQHVSPWTLPPAMVYAIAAVLGDVTGSVWVCPSEVVKQRLQAGMYTSTREAICGIWREGQQQQRGMGGPIRGFYKGYTGGLARDVPFRVAQLTTFELTKSIYLRTKTRTTTSTTCRGEKVTDTSKQAKVGQEPLSALEAAVCGAIAGSFSAAITNPLDRIKTLMMTDVTNMYGGSVLACATQMIRNDGVVRGLFTGVVPRVAYIAPSVCIFFATYEYVQQKMNRATE